MKTTIDRFGRVVVPKELRDRFGLQPGIELEIKEHDREIVIKQVAQSTPLQDEDGVLVFTGSAAGDISGSIRAQQEKRFRKLSTGVVR